MNEPKQKKLIPDPEQRVESNAVETLKDQRDAWQQKILNERYPKVEYKDGGFSTPDEIAKKPEVWREW